MGGAGNLGGAGNAGGAGNEGGDGNPAGGAGSAKGEPDAVGLGFLAPPFLPAFLMFLVCFCIVLLLFLVCGLAAGVGAPMLGRPGRVKGRAGSPFPVDDGLGAVRADASASRETKMTEVKSMLMV